MASNVPAGLLNPLLLTPPEPFGYKTAWFAVHSEDMNAVSRSIGQQSPRQVNWQYGVHHAYEYNEYQMFVAPPVKGWVLALGTPILWEAEGHGLERMVELSKQFGEAQLFASVRTSSSYLWARAVEGELLRLFYEGDGNRRVVGETAAAEKDLGFAFFDSTSSESNQPGYWKRKDLAFPDEEHVLKVAGKWSIDPSMLDKMGLDESFGLLGDPDASYPPKPEPIHR